MSKATHDKVYVLLAVVAVICLVMGVVTNWSYEQGVRDTCRMRGYYDARWAGGPRWDGAWYCVELHQMEMLEGER